MKIVTKNAVTCFLNKGNGTFNNTHVVTANEVSKLYLFGNLIAVLEQGVLKVTNAGWFSKTTKERLNGLPNVNIRQSKGKWYLNDNFWDGKLTTI